MSSRERLGHYDATCGARGQETARRSASRRARHTAERRSMVTVDTTPAGQSEILDQVVIRFAGDSGDGMQLVGDRFTEISAAFGNDLATLPTFPSEIRAPAGTIAGVSSF